MTIKIISTPDPLRHHLMSSDDETYLGHVKYKDGSGWCVKLVRRYLTHGGVVQIAEIINSLNEEKGFTSIEK